MGEKKEVPRMLAYMFGEAAELAMQGASAPLLMWAQAMETWLEEREAKCHNSTYRRSMRAWKRLLPQGGKTPWELELEDVEAHMARMKEQGYAATTIKYELSALSAFYQWCSQKGVDADTRRVVPLHTH